MDFARGGTMEGLGGPIRMEEYNFDGIDPTLDACCQREVREMLRLPRKSFESAPY